MFKNCFAFANTYFETFTSRSMGLFYFKTLVLPHKLNQKIKKNSILKIQPDI